MMISARGKPKTVRTGADAQSNQRPRLSFLAPFFGSFFGRAKNEQRKVASKRTVSASWRRSSVKPNEWIRREKMIKERTGF